MLKEGGGGGANSTLAGPRDNKRNVEQTLKQSLNALKLIQHLFNFDSTSFNTVSMGWQTVSTLFFNKIEWMLKQMLKPFARTFYPSSERIKELWAVHVYFASKAVELCYW